MSWGDARIREVLQKLLSHLDVLNANAKVQPRSITNAREELLSLHSRLRTLGLRIVFMIRFDTAFFLIWPCRCCFLHRRTQRQRRKAGRWAHLSIGTLRNVICVAGSMSLIESDRPRTRTTASLSASDAAAEAVVSMTSVLTAPAVSIASASGSSSIIFVVTVAEEILTHMRKH